MLLKQFLLASRNMFLNFFKHLWQQNLLIYSFQTIFCDVADFKHCLITELKMFHKQCLIVWLFVQCPSLKLILSKASDLKTEKFSYFIFMKRRTYRISWSDNLSLVLVHASWLCFKLSFTCCNSSSVSLTFWVAQSLSRVRDSISFNLSLDSFCSLPTSATSLIIVSLLESGKARYQHYSQY